MSMEDEAKRDPAGVGMAILAEGAAKSLPFAAFLVDVDAFRRGYPCGRCSVQLYQAVYGRTGTLALVAALREVANLLEAQC